MKRYPVPETLKQVRLFLELTGYYRRIIEDRAMLAVLLTDLTKKSLLDRVKWVPECEVVLEHCRSLSVSNLC